MTKHLNFIIFLLFSAFTLLINVGSYGVVETSDARYAEISREMFQNKDYIHPNFLDVHHYHKPPLTYQITALGYELFGTNAFGARFFLQIAVIVQLLLVYAISLLLFNDRKTALWSSIIYFSFPIVLISSRNLTTDAFLTTFVLGAIYFWIKYRQSGYYKYLYLFTLSLAFGFLTKGPVIFIVPLPFIVLFNRIERPKQTWSFHHLTAWLLFLIVAGYWFFYLIYENPTFLDYFLGRQTVDRFSKNAFNRTEPFWYFLVFSPLIGLPWLIGILFNFKKYINKVLTKNIYTVLALSFIIPLLFFSISSSKRILYILPIYGLLAILLSQLLAKLKDKQWKKLLMIISVFAVLISLGIIILKFAKVDWIVSNWLIILSIVLLSVVFFIVRSKYTLSTKSVLISVITTGYLLVAGSHIMSKNELEINSSKPVSEFIINQKLNDRNIYIYNSLKPSIAFHLNQSIISLYDGNDNVLREKQFETDNTWQSFWYDLSQATDNENNKLKAQLEKPSVIISYKKPIKEERSWLIESFSHSTKIGKYYIYY